MKRAPFMDFEFETENVTFRPRFETELMVEKAVELLRENSAPSIRRQILDIGTGSGNIAISLTKYISSSRVVALDISDTALRIAVRNGVRHGGENRIKFLRSDLFENVDANYYSDFFDLVISNPPYISFADMCSLSEEVRRDPYIALYGGRDGLDIARRIVKDSPPYLKTEGILLMEIGYDQSPSIKTALEKSGAFYDVEIYKDYSGIDRIVRAKRWKS